MNTRLQCDRRTFLAWGLGTWLFFSAERGTASETAVAYLRIDGMT